MAAAWGCVLLSAVGTPLASRRAFMRSLAAAAVPAALTPLAAPAIINGQSVSDAEAAAAGAVGLYIDLSNCIVCRKGLPATCSGTLIAPNLVLSARHCLDTPAALNGTLDRVVFASDMLSKSAVSRSVEKVVSTRDYGISAEGGGDLILIRFAGTAPPAWRVQELPLGLLPSKAEEAEARRRNSPLYPDGLGMPTLLTYGYGQQSTQGTVDPDKYSAGVLKKIAVDVRTEIRPWAAGFLTTPTEKGTGTCAGDSGGGVVAALQGPGGRIRNVLLGVQAVASIPCEDNQQIFVNPDAFADFLLRASADLGAPLKPSLSWRDF